MTLHRAKDIDEECIGQWFRHPDYEDPDVDTSKRDYWYHIESAFETYRDHKGQIVSKADVMGYKKSDDYLVCEVPTTFIADHSELLNVKSKPAKWVRDAMSSDNKTNG